MDNVQFLYLLFGALCLIIAYKDYQENKLYNLIIDRFKQLDREMDVVVEILEKMKK